MTIKHILLSNRYNGRFTPIKSLKKISIHHPPLRSIVLNACKYYVHPYAKVLSNIIALNSESEVVQKVYP